MKSQIFGASLQKSVFRRKEKTAVLAAAAETLEGYLINLKTNELNITLDDYQQLAVLLNQLRSVKGSDFEYIRQTLVTSLETMLATLNLLARYNDLKNRFEAALAQAKILDNVDTTLAYLKQIRVSLFPDAVVVVQKAQIREEYALYVQRYGPPKDGLFDVTLLANIMAEI